MMGSRLTGAPCVVRLRTGLYGLLGAVALSAVTLLPVRAEDTSGSVVLPESHVATATQVASANNTLLTQPLTVESMLDANSLNMKVARKGGGQVSDILNPVTFALRLGAMVSPDTKFIGGADVTFNALHLPDGLRARIDAEAIISYNLGGGNTVVPLTFDLLYGKSIAGLARVYLGAGVGPYISNTTRFGGKIFIGAGFTKNLGAELGVHFSGYGDPLVTLEARLPLL